MFESRGEGEAVCMVVGINSARGIFKPTSKESAFGSTIGRPLSIPRYDSRHNCRTKS